MNEKPIIVWLRRDLRIEDNPALHAAGNSGKPVIPAFVFDENESFALGSASRWWLHKSLAALGETLEQIGARLIFRKGQSAEAIQSLVVETDADTVFWNRRYAPAQVETDKALMTNLKDSGLTVKSFNGSLLREPWEIKTGSGGHYKVFTPFWRTLQDAGPARKKAWPKIRTIKGPAKHPKSDILDELKLLPRNPDWAGQFTNTWTPGESGAHLRLENFLDGLVDNYTEERNRPDLESTSRLSPHLAFGEIGPLQIWHAVNNKTQAAGIPRSQATKFLSELAWREFSHILLFHYENLHSEPLRQEFSEFPWRAGQDQLLAWQKGNTGYPIIDAGMRQLWQTGWMHNRVRMVVASFLVKHLLIPWQDGARWFWDTLVDADPANNSASWQWVAGCGADAAPYFRIFNPITQGEKFDPNGEYTRHYVSEIAALPDKYLQKPWEAPAEVLKKSGIVLGKTYPKPLVDHTKARMRALKAYDSIKKN